MEDNNSVCEVFSYRMLDEALLQLVSCANNGLGLGVTLILNGQFIYGDLISGKHYCEQMHENITSAIGTSSLSEGIASYFKSLGEETYTKEDKNDLPLNYLHLKNIAYLKGDGYQVNVNSALLRIRIEDVNGFSLGRL